MIDETAAGREIAGMRRFANQSFEPVALAPIRMAIMADPSRMTHSTTDLTARNPAAWAVWEQILREKYAANQLQLDIVTSIKNVRDKLTAVIGPPGTGKTTVLADIMIGALKCSHTVLVCAVSNNAVDKAANSI